MSRATTTLVFMVALLLLLCPAPAGAQVPAPGAGEIPASESFLERHFDLAGYLRIAPDQRRGIGAVGRCGHRRAQGNRRHHNNNALGHHFPSFGSSFAASEAADR